MKTKIKTISPDQNIIEHESGLKTMFVVTDICEASNCELCAYETNGNCFTTYKPCDPMQRKDKRWGYFKQLLP